ncbi:carboxypeptidase-like regulatory domain-containing protein [Zhouia amylolytica]|uniref:carboxypeptidase-like regulatory domain-containing protein n=1 Tax=Zhouia amylolytica TaxID=376730 RepID=UPI0020CB99C6|nr:carboxypeptidase-like regulatory domain-containing protein [Zhouia amylolytica]MCQ0112868.1 carboxypeptidase-like regulatory domain-containing protein [Zhouia amylolytica]
MILRINLLLILGCFGCAFSSAQTTLIKGKVKAPGVLEGIHVINLNTNYATITNPEGVFEIKVALNDSIKFSSVEYLNRTIRIDSTHFKEGKLHITLVSDVNKLDDVVVTPYNLSGSLSNDLNNIKLKKEVSAISLGLPNATVTPPTQSERRLYTARTSAGLIPLDLIINSITGRIKRLKMQVKLEEKEKTTDKVKRSFEKDFYTDHLKIPEHKIDAFIYFCASDPKFQNLLKLKQPLKMLELLQEKSAEFNRFNVSDEGN